METTVHPFERAGLGKSPFRCVGCRENWFEMPGFGRKPGGTCDYCGTGILYEYVIKSSDDKNFVVGCDCVQRTNSVVIGFREERLKLARAKRATKVSERRAIKQAEWDKIRAEEKKVRMDSFYALKPELVTRLSNYEGSNSFLKSMSFNLSSWGSLTEKMVAIVERLFAEEDRDAALRLTAKYFGEVGVRVKNVKVKINACIKVGESNFGYRSQPIVLVKMETETGEQLTWFTSSYFDTTNEFISASFSVKEHGEYKGIKQTIVQRVTFK